MEQLTKNIIHLIEAEAHTSGLTNKIKNKLYLAIDGELPPEEVSEEEEEFVLEKPKLQNFKEELEQEEMEAEEEAEQEAEEENDKEDKPDIAEVIEELKRKNKNKDNTISLGDNSNNSFILNNK
jgi:exosome complex component RRP4